MASASTIPDNVCSSLSEWLLMSRQWKRWMVLQGFLDERSELPTLKAMKPQGPVPRGSQEQPLKRRRVLGPISRSTTSSAAASCRSRAASLSASDTVQSDGSIRSLSLSSSSGTVPTRSSSAAAASKAMSPLTTSTKPGLTIPKTPSLLKPCDMGENQKKRKYEVSAPAHAIGYEFGASPLVKKVVMTFTDSIPDSFRPVDIDAAMDTSCDPPETTAHSHLTLAKTPKLKSRLGAVADSRDQVLVFRARSVPKKILDTIVGVKPAVRTPPTLAQSPSFMFRRSRQLAEKLADVQPLKPAPFVFHPAPDFTAPFKPELKHEVTSIKPFSFEERTQELLRRKAEKCLLALEPDKQRVSASSASRKAAKKKKKADKATAESAMDEDATVDTAAAAAES